MANDRKAELKALLSQKYADSQGAEETVPGDLGLVGGPTPANLKDKLDLAKPFVDPEARAYQQKQAASDYASNLKARTAAPPVMQAMPAGNMAATTSAPPGVPTDGSGDVFPDLSAQNAAQAAGMSGEYGADKNAALNDVGQMDSQGQGALDQQGAMSDKAQQDADRAALEVKHYETVLGQHQDAVQGKITVEAQRYQDKMDQINSDADIAMKTQVAAIQTAMKSAQQFQFRDFWASRSSMGTAMGILAAALGGAANGVAGTPGQPTPLDRVIAQDLEQQKLEYGQVRDNVTAQRSLFSDLVAQTGSVRAAEIAFHGAVTDKFTSMMAQASTGISDQKAQANYLAARAANQASAATRMQQYTTSELDLKKTELGANVQIHLQQQRLASTMMSQLGAAQQDRLSGQGVIGGKFTQGEAVKMNQQIQTAKSAVTLIDQMAADPSLFQDPARRAQLQSLAASIFNQGRQSVAGMERVKTGLVGEDNWLDKATFGVGGALLNRLDPTDKTRLSGLRARILSNVAGSARGRGGIIWPMLPDGQKNPLFSEALDRKAVEEFKATKGRNRVSPDPETGGAAPQSDPQGME
jgi:hypothetical protein